MAVAGDPQAAGEWEGDGMSLPVLVAIVAIGIAVIVLAIHLTGGSKVALIESQPHARTRFAEDFPDERIVAIHVTGDRRSAWLELDRGRVGLVHSIGARFLTRLFRPADIVSLRRAGETGLLLRTGDITFAGGRFDFADAATAGRIASLLQPNDTLSNEAA
jgi:hypothetical protein